jgi:hypothetical protein
MFINLKETFKSKTSRFRRIPVGGNEEERAFKLGIHAERTLRDRPSESNE